MSSNMNMNSNINSHLFNKHYVNTLIHNSNANQSQFGTLAAPISYSHYNLINNNFNDFNGNNPHYLGGNGNDNLNIYNERNYSNYNGKNFNNNIAFLSINNNNNSSNYLNTTNINSSKTTMNSNYSLYYTNNNNSFNLQNNNNNIYVSNNIYSNCLNSNVKCINNMINNNEIHTNMQAQVGKIYLNNNDTRIGGVNNFTSLNNNNNINNLNNFVKHKNDISNNNNNIMVIPCGKLHYNSKIENLDATYNIKNQKTIDSINVIKKSNNNNNNSYKKTVYNNQHNKNNLICANSNLIVHDNTTKYNSNSNDSKPKLSVKVRSKKLNKVKNSKYSDNIKNIHNITTNSNTETHSKTNVKLNTNIIVTYETIKEFLLIPNPFGNISKLKNALKLNSLIIYDSSEKELIELLDLFNKEILLKETNRLLSNNLNINDDNNDKDDDDESSVAIKQVKSSHEQELVISSTKPKKINSKNKLKYSPYKFFFHKVCNIVAQELVSQFPISQIDILLQFIIFPNVLNKLTRHKHGYKSVLKFIEKLIDNNKEKELIVLIEKLNSEVLNLIRFESSVILIQQIFSLFKNKDKMKIESLLRSLINYFEILCVSRVSNCIASDIIKMIGINSVEAENINSNSNDSSNKVDDTIVSKKDKNNSSLCLYYTLKNCIINKVASGMSILINNPYGYGVIAILLSNFKLEESSVVIDELLSIDIEILLTNNNNKSENNSYTSTNHFINSFLNIILPKNSNKGNVRTLYLNI